MDLQDSFKVQYSYITDVGCVRELNEDTVYCSDDLWLVADGMGGHACGEVASQLAAQIIPKEYARSKNLVQAIEHAHTTIVETAQQGNGQYGMGTTVVAAVCDATNYQIAWVGDSRAYLWDGLKGRLRQLSEDHSLMVRLLNSGLISKEEAKNHPQRHMITQCLGSVEIEAIQVDKLEGQWRNDQQILLCSDGLTDEVTDKAITDVLSQDIDDQAKVNQLTELAKELGGKDNISIVLINSPVSAKPSIWQRIQSVFKKG